MSQMMGEKAERQSAFDISSATETTSCWNTSRSMGSIMFVLPLMPKRDVRDASTSAGFARGKTMVESFWVMTAGPAIRSPTCKRCAA